MRHILCTSTTLFALLAATHAQASTPEPVYALSAAAFAQSIGVNTHVGQTAPGNTYSDTATIAAALAYSGIKHLRDDLSIGPRVSVLAYLNTYLGVTFDLVYGYYAPDGGSAVITRDIANVAPSAALIEAIEGPNEPDYFGLYYNGKTGAPAVIASQALIYSLVRQNHSLAGIPVYCTAFSYPAPGGLASPVGNLAPYCNDGNAHIYQGNFSLGTYLPYELIGAWERYAPMITAIGLPEVITEGGWSTLPNDPGGVDEATQAKYLGDYLFDAFSHGIARTYLYELADDAADPTRSVLESHYGLFRSDGSPKPAATLLANLHALLAGAGGSGATLAYSLDNMPVHGHQLLLQTGNKKFILALWNEANLWDPQQAASVKLPSVRVTLNIGVPGRAVSIFDPLVSKHAQSTSCNLWQTQIDLPDHPILLFIDLNASCSP